MSKKYYVVDAPMGCGKTESAISYINNAPRNERILFISPYLDEGERIASSCHSRDIQVIEKVRGAKINDLRYHLSAGHDIASTHALFIYCTEDMVEDIKKWNYTIIIDEAYEVTRPIRESEKKKINFLISDGYVSLDETTGVIGFASEDFREKCFDIAPDIAKMIALNAIIQDSKKIIIWVFPSVILDAFHKIIAMTYLYGAQPMCHYMASLGYEYEVWGVRKMQDGTFSFCPHGECDGFRYDVSAKIHILDDEKLNSIGSEDTALSSRWYKRSWYGDAKKITKLRNNIRGVQKNKFRCSSKDFMWTTFASYQEFFEDKNIKGGFVNCKQRASNKWGDRHYLAYGVDMFTIPDMYNYFKNQGEKMDVLSWALSDMIQWIWRSAIRNGEDIWIYIPSRRMRELLMDWLDGLAKGGDSNG